MGLKICFKKIMNINKFRFNVKLNYKFKPNVESIFCA